MNAVTVQEVIDALQWFASNLRTNPTPINVPKLDIIERIHANGISPPDGMVLVPIIPTLAMEKAIAAARNLKAQEAWADALHAVHKQENSNE